MPIYIYTLKITCYYKFIKDIKEMEKMLKKINEALSEYEKELIELTLLDTLWVTTEKHIYREERDSELCKLAEKIAWSLGIERDVDEVEYELGEIITEKTMDIYNKHIDIEF